MPQPPYALLRASINSGAVQTGGLVVAGSATVQLSADPAGAADVSRYRYEIYDYPIGFAQPTGWSTDSNGVYFYAGGSTPPVFTVLSAATFGKYMLRLTIGDHAAPLTIEQLELLVDEKTSVEVVAISGLHDTGLGETMQWGGLKQWLYHIKLNWRILDAFINAGGGGGGGGVTVHGALTGLAADDHVQYLLVNGTRAMSAALAMGNHKITGLATPTASTDAATKGYVDGLTVSGVIRADGTVPFAANQSLAGFKLTSVGTPTLSGDAATKAYVDATIQPTGVVAFTADQSMGGFKLTSLGAPTIGTDAVNKAYADAIASGMTRVRLATAAALPTNTRTGDVLTASSNGTLTVDGTAVALNDVLLVKNEVTGANNGFYAVTATGGASAPFVLTRTATPINSGMPASITIGTANGGKLAVLKTDGVIAVNTTSLDFQIASGANGAAGADGAPGADGDNGTDGADAFNVIPGTTLTGGTQTIAPGITGMKFTLPAASMSANAVLTLTGGTGLVVGDVVFIEVFDLSAFTYTMRNGGAAPADMRTKLASPGAKRIYSYQWDGADFFPCNSVAVL
jgi:hypothetical protein